VILPNPAKHNPAPDYIRGLVHQATDKHDINQEWIARHWLGLKSGTTIRKWMTAGATYNPCPYACQYLLEMLVNLDKF
jgi:hypothetical protein